MSSVPCSACDRDRRLIGHLFPGLTRETLDKVLCQRHDSPLLAKGVN